MFVVGIWMMDFFYYSEWYCIVLYWYKLVGLLLVGLMLFCLIWKVFFLFLKIEGVCWEIVVVKSVYYLMYVGLFVFFVFGYFILMEDG